MSSIFQIPNTVYYWKDIKTFHLRNQYNEMLYLVINEYFNNQYPSDPPNFLNENACLTLTKFDSTCGCDGYVPVGKSALSPEKQRLDEAERKVQVATSTIARAEKAFDFAVKMFRLQLAARTDTAAETLKAKFKTTDAMNEEERRTALRAITEIKALQEHKDLEGAEAALKPLKNELSQAELAYYSPILEADKNLEMARINLEMARANFNYEASVVNRNALAKAQDEFSTASAKARISTNDGCKDTENSSFCTPPFYYSRVNSVDPKGVDLTLATTGLTVGSVIWLYYYERMGIFKILGALMDDYNYRGKFTISGSRKDGNGNPNEYSVLMDTICTLHRLGIGSNLRDRICTYEHVIGVTINNSLGIDTEKNTGFMKSFNKLMEYMLEYYKAKQLAQAIQSQNGIVQPRSSVATQTSIRDTMNVLKQQFEPLQYGRNQINTFLGIATVHATLCLLSLIRDEIGIPGQYNKPEEFVPAAYDILVAKQKPTQSDTNRFIVYDNCASYGYRLLTDIETVDLDQLPTGSGGALDTWLNDVEGWVEGYQNAYSSLSEKVEAIV